jgi:predicted nucleotidyltransferase
MVHEVSPEIRRAAEVFKALGAREVYVFGSSAHGLSGPASDIDMAVRGLPPSLFFRAMSKASDVLHRPLDLIDLDDDNPFSRYLNDKGDLLRVE